MDNTPRTNRTALRPVKVAARDLRLGDVVFTPSQAVGRPTFDPATKTVTPAPRMGPWLDRVAMLADVNGTVEFSDRLDAEVVTETTSVGGGATVTVLRAVGR